MLSICNTLHSRYPDDQYRLMQQKYLYAVVKWQRCLVHMYIYRPTDCFSHFKVPHCASLYNAIEHLNSMLLSVYHKAKHYTYTTDYSV